MIAQPRQTAKDFKPSEKTQEQHDAKVVADALAYKEQNIANMAKKLRGEEARAAQGKASAAALNAIVAAKRAAEADAAKRHKVDQEIAADLLMTPTHLTGPIGPAPAADSDSDSDEEHEPGTYRRDPWRH